MHHSPLASTRTLSRTLCMFCALALLITAGCGGADLGDGTGGDATGGNGGTPGGTFVPDPAGERLFEDLVANAPAADASPTSALPPNLGPDGSAFGLLLEEGGEVFVKGDLTGDNARVEGSIVRDNNGNLLMEETISPDGRGLHTLLGTGDAIEYHREDDGRTRITMTFDATTPPTVLTAFVEQDGTVTMDENQPIGAVPNEAYAGFTGTLLTKSQLQGATLVGKSEKARVAKLSDEECTEVGNNIKTVVDTFCTGAGFIGNTVAEAVVGSACVLISGVLGLAESDAEGRANEEAAVRAIAGIRLGLTVLCKYASDAISVATSASNPVLLAVNATCFALSATDDASKVVLGGGIVEQICDILDDEVVANSEVTTASAVINIRDTGVEDGDAVQVTHNGASVFSGTATSDGASVSVELVEGLNKFQVIATSVGDTAPNTARVTINDTSGAQVHRQLLAHQAGESMSINLFHRP